jgi:hypothetical protein
VEEYKIWTKHGEKGDVADDQGGDDESMPNEAGVNRKHMVSEERSINREDVINDRFTIYTREDGKHQSK